MPEISIEDQQFLFKMVTRLAHETNNKFNGGVQEHGGHIWEIPLLEILEEAKKEFIDGYTYVHTALEVLEILLQDPEIQKKVTKIQQNLMDGAYNKNEDK